MKEVIVMDNKKKVLIFTVLLTYVVGLIGFGQVFVNDFLQCLYATTCLFFMNILVAAEEVNVFIELARWFACFVSVQAVVLVFEKMFSHVKSSQLVKDENLVVVHGDNASLIDAALSNSIVFNDEGLWKAKRHLFYFSEDQKLFDYLSQNSSFINDHQSLFLMTHGVNRSEFIKDNISVCNVSEMCARHYWRTYPLLFTDRKIVIIGNGAYVEELLDYAIMLNVIKKDSNVEYHVFTDDTSYLLKHTELDQCISVNKKSHMRDSLFIHNESWMVYHTLIEECDRIILADENDENNLMILNTLKRDYHCANRIDIRYLYDDIVYHIWGKDIHVFGPNNDMLNEEIILNDKANYIAKNIHAKYFKNYVCPMKDSCKKDSCIKCKEFVNDWNSLSSFLRYSNIAQGDHMFYKIRILKHLCEDETMSLEEFYKSLNEEELLVLDEIEHIRWNRYHYFHNWKYAEVRNNSKRQHPLLVPFEELSYEEKIKDRDTWTTALLFHKKKMLD